MSGPVSRTVALGATLLWLFPLALAPASHAREGYPPIINIYLRAGATAEEIQDLARYDALVLDADFPLETPGGIAQIRQLNPDILIYAYVPCNGVLEGAAARPAESVFRKYWDACEANDWWLYDTQGNYARDWPGKRSTNLTSHSPLNSQGESVGQWFARFMTEVVYGTGHWDGLFLDDTWDDIAWLNSLIPDPIDSDRNGVADPGDDLDADWKATTHAMAARLRQLVGPTVPLLGNGGNTAYDTMNGAMLEDFPIIGPNDGNNPYGYAWTYQMFTAKYSYTQGLAGYTNQPVTMIINAFWEYGTDEEPDRSGRFEAHKRFMLGSTLLYDGWFSFDRTVHENGSLWWEPEFDIYLGNPLGPAQVADAGGVSVYRRDFEAATVVVNPNNSPLAASTGIPALGDWDAYIGPPLAALPPDITPPALVDTYWGWPEDEYNAVLRWRAVGDDSLSGRADHVEVRHSPVKIWTEAEWDAATVVPNDNVPAFAGTWEQIPVPGLQPETTYYFMVRAHDDAGNRSGMGSGNFFRIITPAAGAGDTQPPATPVGLSATGSSSAVQLTWGMSGEADFGHYNVYRATLPSPSVLHRTGLTQPVLTDSEVAPGNTYGYRITAVDQTGNESAPTGEIRVAVPHVPGGRIPDHFAVSAAWPSPTPSGSAVTVSTTEAMQVRLEVYDVRGRRLAAEDLMLGGAGDYILPWDGNDADGRPAASGVYWIRVRSAAGEETRRVMIMRGGGGN